MIVTIVTLWLFRVPMRFWGDGGYRHHHRHPIVTIVTRRWGDGPVTVPVTVLSKPIVTLLSRAPARITPVRRRR
jgi:hypothetical protein